ncbi:hypothetical protein HanRHA438_Chr10g0477961 [Helianthus annuus]|nr:hypothetical protein HanRHA438_Chr10g0477961 [Helianthus annuus]
MIFTQYSKFSSKLPGPPLRGPRGDPLIRVLSQSSVSSFVLAGLFRDTSPLDLWWAQFSDSPLPLSGSPLTSSL